MAKIFRFSGYLVDLDEVIVPEYLGEDLAEWFSDSVNMEQFHIESSDSFTATVDSPEFKVNCDLAHLEKHFQKPQDSGRASEVVIGGKYRHFKGKIITVIAVARDTENGGLSVVYECQNGIYNRPLDMFLSEVDHEKYPDIKQKMRFELVED